MAENARTTQRSRFANAEPDDKVTKIEPKLSESASLFMKPRPPMGKVSKAEEHGVVKQEPSLPGQPLGGRKRRRATKRHAKKKHRKTRKH